MPSRKKRKRDRHRAEATATEPELRGGWGQGLPVSRGDLLLVRKAIRNGWPAPAAVRRAVVDDVYLLVTDDSEDYNTTDNVRLLVAVARCALAMEGENQRLEHLAQSPQ